MKYIFTIAFLALCCLYSYAQQPGGGRPGMGGGRNMNVGHLYGKIVDSKTNKGIDGVSVQLVGNKFDTTTKKAKDYIVATVLTQSNGDFSLENLPVFGKLRLRATAVGYTDLNQPVSFDIKMPQGGGQGAQGSEEQGSNRMQQMLGMVDKDLGNIKLAESDATLANVTVTASKPFFEMGVDRKIFNVDKNIVSSGQTATEVMKQIPSVNVDIDGNVTLRNSSPQLFVDGRPTTLTLDQIPADIIDKVELITNPSAKYDASSGGGGILNIVLKKNKKTGYNGGVRAGIDSRGKFNTGLDLNLRQGKINFFASGMYNQRKSKSTSYTDRTNTVGTPSTVHQSINGVNDGEFAFVRSGFDYFMDNRNTLTVTGSYVHGKFNNNQPQRIDSTINDIFSSYNDVQSFSKSSFKNFGGQLSFKHNFAKNGHDLTADFNYNSSTNTNNASLNTYNYKADNTQGYDPVLQNTYGNGYNRFWTIQSDYENPLTENSKLEGGVRAAIRNFKNTNDQYFYNDATGKYEISDLLSSAYKFTDQVYAAYGTYTLKTGKWNYQLGLRAESSNYKGTVLSKDSTFKVKYPLSIFPTAFITYKLDDKQDMQFNYSRKVNRPSFFQLMPFVDYSDPQNLSVGNAGLKPEFTNTFEVNYNNSYTKGANFLASAYFKYATDLITRYQYRDINPKTNDSSIYNTYVNANNSITYGLELTNRMTLAKIWDVSLNFNLYNSKINTNNLADAGTSNQRVSWFAKWNNNIKLPKGFSIQISGDYQAKTVLPPNSGGGGFGGGGGGGRGGGGGGFGGGGGAGTAQGYIFPRYSFDFAIRKDWSWKGGNSLSLTLSMNDFLRTQLYKTYSESDFLYQITERRRDPQVARLNINYRFGKLDTNLFKRKNTRAEQGGGMDMMQNN